MPDTANVRASLATRPDVYRFPSTATQRILSERLFDQPAVVFDDGVPMLSDSDRGCPYRMSVDESHRLVARGLIPEEQRIELIDGVHVHQMSRGSAHDYAITVLDRWLQRVLPPEWCIRAQCAITLAASEPEPDLAVVKAPLSRYRDRHPGPDDVVLAIEVSASSLDFDRTDKARIYADAGISEYWIVSIPERQVEVLTKPTGAVTDAASYKASAIVAPGQQLALALAGAPVAALDVTELFGSS